MIDPEAVLQSMRDSAPQYAQAKAERIYLEEFRRSKKAILMQQARADGTDSVNGQERDALAHDEYMVILDGLFAATEVEERLRWQLEVSRLEVDVWRTQQASERMILRSHE